MHVAVGVQAWLLAMKELHKINNYKVGLVRQAVACSTMTGAAVALQHKDEPWTGGPSPRWSPDGPCSLAILLRTCCCHYKLCSLVRAHLQSLLGPCFIGQPAHPRVR